MDLILHAHRRAADRSQRTHQAAYADLPDGTFVAIGADAFLVLGEKLFEYDPTGYRAPCQRPADGMATVLTPLPIVRVLAAGYRPLFHPSAA